MLIAKLIIHFFIIVLIVNSGYNVRTLEFWSLILGIHALILIERVSFHDALVEYFSNNRQPK